METATYKQIYDKLYQLIPDLDSIREARKLKAPGFMDLNIDVLESDPQYKRIALSHYYKHESGDMIPDPDMEIRIDKRSKTAEAMTYQDLWRYDQVYVDDEQLVNERLKTSMNQFLLQWLANLISQGHK